jgi:transcriptional antiterminator NusG
MDLFVLQCLTGKEDRVRTRIHQNTGSDAPLIHIPRRRMRIRRAGRMLDEEYLLFPGYLFIEADEISAKLLAVIRNIPEAMKFLPENQRVLPLGLAERELMATLLYQGEVIGDSAVRFDDMQRISVIRGPLKGLEGHIVKVNRRKGRAKVRLDLYDRKFEVDFSFFDLEKARDAENN